MNNKYVMLGVDGSRENVTKHDRVGESKMAIFSITYLCNSPYL